MNCPACDSTDVESAWKNECAAASSTTLSSIKRIFMEWYPDALTCNACEFTWPNTPTQVLDLASIRRTP